MNIRSLYLPVLLIAAGAIMLIGAGQLASSDTAAERYKSCSALISSNPAKALAMAQDWHKKNPQSAPARHCEALALYGMKNYVPAATVLEELAKETATKKPDLSVNLLSQAATARTKGGNTLMAVQDLDYALTLDPNNSVIKSQLSDLSSK